MRGLLVGLGELKQSLLGIAQGQSVSDDEIVSQVRKLSEKSGDLLADLEIIFRSALADLINSLPPKTSFDINQPSIRLIKLTIDIALNNPDLCSACAKLPYILIEDLLESQTIQTAKNIWRIVESWTDSLTQESLFSRGKFTMLKTCNSLLRKLSKSCDTEFCGRILLFLATIYPLSERSALNLMGRVNTSNITYTDTEEMYAQHIEGAGAYSLPPLPEDGAGAGANGVEGAHEEGEEVEGQHKKDENKEKDKNKRLEVTYDLYSRFWKLQSFFASESKTFDDPKDFWKNCMSHIQVVVDMLERTKGAAKTSDSLGGHSEEEKSGCKFLTSSQLFALQLQDPMLRQQIAVELLFFAHYFKVKAVPLIVDADKRTPYLTDLATIHNQAGNLLQNPSMLKVIEHILQRETRWIDWKNATCPPFERPPADLKVGEKRKAEDSDNIPAVTNSKPSRPIPTVSQLSKKYVTESASSNKTMTVSQDNVANVFREPDFDDLVNTYLEADDPDAGIEEEYHPKHNQLYCWRTRRLLAERSVSVFKYMPDGNLGKGLRKLRGLPEPEPVVPQPVEDDDSMGLGEKTAEEGGEEMKGEADNDKQEDDDEDIYAGLEVSKDEATAVEESMEVEGKQ